jgi:peptide deformylase
MAVLDVLIHPDPRLRKISKKIDEIDEEMSIFLDDLTETMYVKDGVGLAAPQVGVLKRVVVIDISDPEEESKNPIIFINPEIIQSSGEVFVEEGCLSVPKIYEEVGRFEKVIVKAFDKNMKEFTIEADEMLSVAIQHEIDHLNGKLFIDKLSSLKYTRITQKMIKYKKKQEENKKKKEKKRR